ncbi:MAG: hypothetical protein RR601_06055 [Erysipelotrichales bacterium]
MLEAFLDRRQRDEIGFEFVLNKIEVLSVYGKELLVSQAPFSDEEALNREFDYMELVKTYLADYDRLMKESEIYFARIKNINHILDSVELVCLDEVDIFEIKKFAFNVMKLNNCFKQIENISSEFILYDYTDLFNYLDLDGSQMPFFSLYDSYSPKMAELRRQIKEDNYTEAELEKVKLELKEEEVEVKKEISSRIAAEVNNLYETVKQVAYLDLLIAKVKLAIKYNLSKPSVSSKLELKQAYNPHVKEIVEEKGYKYIPLDIIVEQDIQLITGSNMSGKSVTLKNIILNTLCFQYGIYPFAQEAKLPLLEYVVFISDELQDVANSLSSFGKEVHVLSEALSFIEGKRGLIVLDEFARGTNPIEAKMIVVGLCKYLKTKDAYSVLSTHLDLELDMDYHHYQVVGLGNYDDDIETSEDILNVMDYSLTRVDQNTKVPNDAFKVMNFLNLNRELKNLIEKEYEKEITNEQN